jgi:membrane protein
VRVIEPAPETPEERRLHPDSHPRQAGWRGVVGPGSWAFEVGRRIVLGVWREGFGHAGNLAYLTLLTLFPFFIVTTAIATLIGKPEENLAAVDAVLTAVPPSVAAMLHGAAIEVMNARTGPLLWFGGLVGLWTIAGYIGALRDTLKRAYGVEYSRPFWHYRLAGILVVVVAVTLILFAFSVQVFVTAAEEVVTRFLPALGKIETGWLDPLWPTLLMYGALYMMFWSLAPGHYRAWVYPKWPGALFTTLWWFGAVSLMPKAVALFGGYTLTYGSLAGVMIALLFFWQVGYGVVVGAHVNAALANPAKEGLRDKHNVLDELAEAKWLDT